MNEDIEDSIEIIGESKQQMEDFKQEVIEEYSQLLTDSKQELEEHKPESEQHLDELTESNPDTNEYQIKDQSYDDWESSERTESFTFVEGGALNQNGQALAPNDISESIVANKQIIDDSSQDSNPFVTNGDTLRDNEIEPIVKDKPFDTSGDNQIIEPILCSEIEAQLQAEPEPQSEPMAQSEPEPISDAQAESQVQSEPETQAEPTPDSQPEQEVQSEPEPQVEPILDAQLEKEIQSEPETKSRGHT